MAKVEVQVRSCVCCGLTPGSLMIGIYTLLLYCLFLILAVVALSKMATLGEESNPYTKCELEAQGKIEQDTAKLRFGTGRVNTTIDFWDTTSYNCSFGLYTEENKFSSPVRHIWLLVDVILFSAIIVASIVLIVGVITSIEWLLIPWLFLMALEIIRGAVSTVFIFLLTYGNLARIATAIFFLGLQTLHFAFWLLIIAKFQRIYNRKHGYTRDGQDQYYDSRYPPPPRSLYTPYSPQPGEPRKIPINVLPPPGGDGSPYHPPGSGYSGSVGPTEPAVRSHWLPPNEYHPRY